MGTHALTVVMLEKKPVIAHVSYYDGYPDGLGVDILKQLRRWEWNLIREKLHVYHLLPKDEFERFKVNRRLDEDALCKAHPHFFFGDGAQLLEKLLDSKPDDFIESRYMFSYGYDSLNCEWAYVIDLDYNMLFVYRGLNETPLSPNELFYTEKDIPHASNGYYPLRLCAMYNIEKLPDDELFVKGVRQSVKRQDAIQNGEYKYLAEWLGDTLGN